MENVDITDFSLGTIKTFQSIIGLIHEIIGVKRHAHNSFLSYFVPILIIIINYRFRCYDLNASDQVVCMWHRQKLPAKKYFYKPLILYYIIYTPGNELNDSIIYG